MPQSPPTTVSPLNGAQLRRYQFLQRLRPALLADGLKAALGIKRVPVDVRGIRMLVDPCSHFGLKVLVHGAYETDMCDVFTTVLAPGGTCVDVGANEGYFSLLAASLVGSAGLVVAVEPQPRLAGAIAANIELNGFENIRFAPVALSDADGTKQIFLSPSLNSGSSGFTRTTRYPLRRTPVTVTTLEHLLDANRIDKVDLMKIDVEGHEYEVVLGSRAVFAERRVRFIALEMHPTILAQRGLAAEDITRFLEQCGYARDSRFAGLVYAAA